MGITFKVNHFEKLVEREMSEATEQNYLESFRKENSKYISDAQSLTAHESGLYWTEADETMLNTAQAITKKLDTVRNRMFSPINTLNAATMTHKPLTEELVEERKAAMLEAVAIYREAQHKFAGKVGEEYARRVDELERKANSLSVHDGSFNVSRYI